MKWSIEPVKISFWHHGGQSYAIVKEGAIVSEDHEKRWTMWVSRNEGEAIKRLSEGQITISLREEVAYGISK
jgi:hypothetical protein